MARIVSIDNSSQNSSRLEPLKTLIGLREGRVLRRGPSNGSTARLDLTGPDEPMRMRRSDNESR